jgi:polyphosphate kinase 2 (PPK2 family)
MSNIPPVGGKGSPDRIEPIQPIRKSPATDDKNPDHARQEREEKAREYLQTIAAEQVQQAQDATGFALVALLVQARDAAQDGETKQRISGILKDLGEQSDDMDSST